MISQCLDFEDRCEMWSAQKRSHLIVRWREELKTLSSRIWSKRKKERKKERNETKRSISKWQDKFLILWG